MTKPSQKQLARLLNLSRATIHRSLSNHQANHPETRAKVQALAMKLGYDKTPTRIIRRSRKSTPLSIGVLVGMPAINYGMATYPAVLQGIRSRAAIDHVEVTIINQDPISLDLQTPRQPVFQQIRANDWRGIILIYPFAPDVVDQISKKISTVSALTEYDHLAIDTVDTDHSDIIGVIGRLANLGHRRVGFVTWHYSVGTRCASRHFAVYTDSIFHYAMPFDP